MPLAAPLGPSMRALLGAFGAAIALLGLQPAAAQETAEASAIETATLAAVDSSPVFTPLMQHVEAYVAAIADARDRAKAAFDTVANTDDADAASINGYALDDKVLSKQRGGAAGMMMVAGTPEFARDSLAVTLWDEIAPPPPLPVPVDSGRAAQGNSASYTRK